MNEHSQLLDEHILVSEQNQTEKEGKSEDQKINFPYERSIYIKGILAIPLALSIAGFMLALYLLNISLKRSSESLREYKKNPDSFKQSSLKKVKQGRTAAYIALFIWIAEIVAFLLIN